MTVDIRHTKVLQHNLDENEVRGKLSLPTRHKQFGRARNAQFAIGRRAPQITQIDPNCPKLTQIIAIDQN